MHAGGRRFNSDWLHQLKGTIMEDETELEWSLEDYSHLIDDYDVAEIERQQMELFKEFDW